MRFHPYIRALVLLLAAWSAPACQSVEHAIGDEHRLEDRLAWWRSARFGLFVHWGLYAIPAGEWNGRTGYGEWIRANARVPLAEYDRLAERWNPREFDAGAWARLAADAGMKYMVVTTKHHDGFPLFDSRASTWDVAATPFHRDVMAEVADACRANGIVPCWYYSIMDWHHPDYLPRRGWETDRPTAGADFDRYESYVDTQVTELLTRYGPIGAMWFDGDWENTWTFERGMRLYDLCRRLQPNVIVNNRIGAGRSRFQAFVEGADGAGDFATPEQEVPSTQTNGADWEACITMNDNWGYNARDHRFKSTGQILRTLVDSASKGGNLLLNVGPDADGRIPAECVERLQAIGRWMRVNGEAIWDTTACPVEAPPFGRLTMRRAGDTTHLFLHVFQWPADGRLVLDSVGNRVRAAHMLADPQRDLGLSSRPGHIELSLTGAPVDPDVDVVELELEGELIPYVAPLIETESDVFLDEALITVASPSQALEARYTLDGSEPTPASPLANGPFALRASAVVRARTFHDGTPVGEIATRAVFKEHPLAAQALGTLAPGLILRTGTGGGERIDGPWHLSEDSCLAEVLSVPAELRSWEHSLLEFEGFVRVDRDDVYTFRLDSDDASRIVVDDQVVCDQDGSQPHAATLGSVALAAGWHALRVRHLNVTGPSALHVRMGGAGRALAPLAPRSLGHRP